MTDWTSWGSEQPLRYRYAESLSKPVKVRTMSDLELAVERARAGLNPAAERKTPVHRKPTIKRCPVCERLFDAGGVSRVYCCQGCRERASKRRSKGLPIADSKN